MSMLAAQQNSTFAMADDSMDMLSDQGRDAGNEDIDIDIDLTAGQPDEDDILQDAEPNDEYNDFLQPQTEADGNDDPMVDDDAASYMMDDTDVGADQQESTDREGRPQSPLAVDVPSEVDIEPNTYEEHAANLQFTSEGIVTDGHSNNDDTTQAYDYTQQRQVPIGDSVEVKGHSPKAHSPSIKDIVAEEIPAGVVEIETFHTTKSDAEGQQQVFEPADILEPQSPSIQHSVQQSQHLAPDEAANDINADQSAEHITTGDETDAGDVENRDSAGYAPQYHPVEVYFNGRMYPLIRTTESDNPDDYFFEDYSYTELSLVDFFKELRDVLRVYFDADRDETDYEICMYIEDLGLQMVEVSNLPIRVLSKLTSFVQDTLPDNVTFAQIMNVHETLQQNEDMEAVSPMTVRLLINLRFAVRLQDLLRGAQEGKGLSEMIIEEGSELSDGTAGPIDAESYAALDTTDGDDNAYDAENQETVASQERSNTTGNTKTQDNLDNTSNELAPSSYQDEESSDAQNRLDLEAQNSNTKASTREEEDLIDYEDEEEQEKAPRGVTAIAANGGFSQHDANNGTSDNFVTPCLKPNVCFCPRCNEEILADLEAKNEELRRRSISRVAEDRTPEPDLQEEHLEENSDDGNDGITYEEGTAENEDEYENGGDWDQVEYHEDPEASFNEAQTAGVSTDAARNADEFTHDNVDFDDYEELNGDATAQDRLSPTAEGYLDEEADLGTAHNLDALDDEYNFDDAQDQTEALNPEDTQARSKVDEIQIDFGEEAERDLGSFNTELHQPASVTDAISSENVDIKTSTDPSEEGLVLISDQKVEAITKSSDLTDEIDYDDDDDEPPVKNNNTPMTPTSVTLTNGSGKRLRTDEDFEDASNASSKGMLEPPSKRAKVI